MDHAVVDVLVIGAGPVGLTMASALEWQGVSWRCVEKVARPTDKSKALVVWARTMELLDPLGLAETFVATGLKISGGSIYADYKRVVHFGLTGSESPFGFPLMIPQSETERLLTENLARQGKQVEREVELVTFRELEDCVEATLRHADGREETVRAAWLVGCDGAHSTVRHTLGMEFTGHAEPNDWMLADVHIKGSLSADEVSVFWHEKGVLAFFPMGRDRFRVIADLGAADEPARRPDPTLADVQAKLDERGPGDLTATDPVWLANFRINERKVADYRRGRVMLAGDAAHIHSPAGGQGMNTGMQDAFNLAWKLALVVRGVGQAESLLTSYSVERSAVGDQVLKAAEQFTTIATLRNPIAQAIRNHLAPIVTSFQFVQDKIRHQWWETSINYRKSPLSAEDGSSQSGTLRAGDRMPDVQLGDVASNESGTLFKRFDAVRHTLLLLPSADDEQSSAELMKIAESVREKLPDVFETLVILQKDGLAALTGYGASSAGPTVWRDVEGGLYSALGVTGDALVWVRPDGYIGYRCEPASEEKLCGYLGKYLKLVGKADG